MQKRVPFTVGPLFFGTDGASAIRRIPVSRADLRASSARLAVVRYQSMSPNAPDRDITTESEFDSALQSLLLSALDNGLDLRGTWEYRNGRAYPHLEVMVTELAKPK